MDFSQNQSLNIPQGALLFEALQSGRTFFLVAETEASAQKIAESAQSLRGSPPVLLFPGIELMPFSQGVPSPDILSERIRVLSLLRQNPRPYTIILSHRSFCRLLPPAKAFDKALIPLQGNESYSIDGLCQKLESYGYTRTSLVRETGEYSLKNRLLDVFPPDTSRPLRLIFEENQNLARIALFNAETQLSEENIPSCSLPPLAEFMFPKDKAGFIWPSPLAHSNFTEYYSSCQPVTAYCRGPFSVAFIESPSIEDNKMRAVFSRLNADKLLSPSFLDAAKGAQGITERSVSGKELPEYQNAGSFSGGFSGFTVEMDNIIAKFGENHLVCLFSEYEESARRIAIMLRRFHPRLLKNYSQLPPGAKGFYVIVGSWEFGFSRQDAETPERTGRALVQEPRQGHDVPIQSSKLQTAPSETPAGGPERTGRALVQEPRQGHDVPVQRSKIQPAPTESPIGGLERTGRASVQGHDVPIHSTKLQTAPSETPAGGLERTGRALVQGHDVPIQLSKTSGSPELKAASTETPVGGIIMFVGEGELSGKRKLFRRRLKQSIFTPFEKDIQSGDAVVHLNHGIGIFKGIQRITVLDKEKDYILIEYADKQKLFVPLEQADLIGRYAGSMDDAKKPKLDSLSGKSWQKKKTRAQEDILRFAKQLVEAHAKRIALEGTAFPPDGEEQKIFEDKFPYIETPDQIKVIEEIKADMEDPKPMDRLLCGDVGFGKTEIALRAAFKAIYAGTQAALLAPTTILAEQHYLTCLERFKDFPVKIALLTRFSEYEERKDLLKKLANQEIDLLIGTHAILSKAIAFKNLGLLVIDEEHKFGVEQKEKIKFMHPLTDILSLSATPIPRTLSLALGSLRSFSTLQTPPELRVPVETIVSDFREDIVKDAIRSELDRGGQVYFIQNRIKELPAFAELIAKLVPEASVVTAHGRMGEEELEEAFLGFMRGAYKVLISTTIVESGLDIPNANTLIVSDSQRLGLSQLYQLKGRVGRSSKQAFAYFLFPEHKNITETANKRLDALAEYTELGAGFQIARQDMEIRGAGNILGEEQHGHLSAIGYDMYMCLLREEVQRLQGTFKEITETLVDLAYDAFIPDNFIADPALKMDTYKQILSLRAQDSAAELKKELADRYGPLPPELDTLFAIARLKIEAGAIGIASITEKTRSIEIIFSAKSQADPLKVMAIAKNGSHPVHFSPFNPHLLTYETFSADAEQKVHRLMSFIRDIRE